MLIGLKLNWGPLATEGVGTAVSVMFPLSPLTLENAIVELDVFPRA
jgi:hypothetical protein